MSKVALSKCSHCYHVYVNTAEIITTCIRNHSAMLVHRCESKRVRFAFILPSNNI